MIWINCLFVELEIGVEIFFRNDFNFDFCNKYLYIEIKIFI